MTPPNNQGGETYEVVLALSSHPNEIKTPTNPYFLAQGCIMRKGIFDSSSATHLTFSSNPLASPLLPYSK